VGSVTGIRRDALIVFFFQAEDGIRDSSVTGVQTCALPIYPSIDPIVDENMLADPRDIARMRDAVKRLAVITQQPALQGIADWIRLGDTELTLPQAAALPDAELDALLRRVTGDIQHAAGSCRMSGFADADGVVNPDGTVKGIGGLRVADASIMPADCRANTHFTTVVIGE